MVLNVKALGWRFAAVVLVVVMAVAAWAILLRDGSLKAVPRILPKTAQLVDWSSSCIATVTAWGTGAILLATSGPAGWVTVAGWGLGVFGAYQSADACSVAKNYYGPPIAKTCFTSGNYKGTYNGVKYYTKATAACANGMGAGGGGGGSW